jgi:hypothetical protein
MADEKKPKSKDAVLAEALEAFKLCSESQAEQDNRDDALDDLKFARLGEQWPDYAVKSRGKERCMLTINKMPAFIRQVVNDARQNKPRIAVKPVDDKADPLTAKVYDGLIRNIEYTSNADVAYDTGAEFAVSMGWGYWRVAIDYACEDSFDKDIRIERIANPFSIYGDPHSTAADSSDWNLAFVVDQLSKDEFEDKYKGADKVSWDSGSYGELKQPWKDGDQVQIAEWWSREEVPDSLLMVQLASGEKLVVKKSRYEEKKAEFDAGGAQVMEERPTRSYKVVQRIMSGAEILETNDWAGKYIPLIPCYGEELNVDSRRYFRSLIRDAKDAQRMHNFWRTASTELVALAPKTPWIGRKGAFDSDQAKWESANTQNHAYMEYDGPEAPQRQQFVGVPAGHLQEALNANDDMKAIMGLYDASLGARSNETSGVAINARQQEGDVSTFHFLDNLRRAIAHTGRILLDLIPAVYTGERMIRVLGDEGQVQNIPLGQPVAVMPDGSHQPVPPGTPQQALPQGVNLKVYDLTLGKYDLAVEAGPSNTTQRQASVEAITEIIRSFPMAAPVLGPTLVKLMDFPHAQEIADELKQAAQAAQQNGQGDAQLQKAMAVIGQLKVQLAQAKSDHDIDAMRLQIEAFEAQTDRARAVKEIVTPAPQPQPRPLPRPAA